LEVEAAMLAHPGLSETAAVERSVKADTRVIALYYTGPARVDEAELAQFAAARLARYKCPRQFIHLPDLPMSGNGKIDRRALREAP
ncbi:MAG: benzoate--CoA ligase, partial [Pseudomonadota bacterium]